MSGEPYAPRHAAPAMSWWAIPNTSYAAWTVLQQLAQHRMSAISSPLEPDRASRPTKKRKTKKS